MAMHSAASNIAQVLALQVAGDNSMEVLQRAMENSHCKSTALVVTLDSSVGARCMLEALCTQASSPRGRPAGCKQVSSAHGR